jgi:hypothetical protein
MNSTEALFDTPMYFYLSVYAWKYTEPNHILLKIGGQDGLWPYIEVLVRFA